MCAGPIQARLRTRGESDDAGKYVEVLREEANTKGTLYCEVRLVGDVRGRAEWVRPEFLEYPRSSANIEDRAEQAEPSAYDFIPASGGATTQDDLAGFQVKQQALHRTRIMRRSCLPIGRASEQRAVCAECSQCRARAIDSDVAPNCDAEGAAARDRLAHARQRSGFEHDLFGRDEGAGRDDGGGSLRWACEHGFARWDHSQARAACSGRGRN